MPRVLVEQPQIARSEHDAPDVDCRVVFESALPVGDIAEVTVTGSQVYDLVAIAPEKQQQFPALATKATARTVWSLAQ